MTNRRLPFAALALLGALLPAACAPAATRESPPPRDADVYAVWGVMVDSLLGAGYDRRLPVMVDTVAEALAPRTDGDRTFAARLRSDGGRLGVTDAMIAAFTSSDSAPARIDRAVLARYTRMNVTPSPADFAHPDTIQMLRAGMTGRVRLSRVAFDASRSLALVDGSWVCGGLCGHGFTSVMEKDAAGRWREKSKLMIVFF